MERILHDVGKEHLGGTDEEEVGEGGREERPPQPDVPADVPQALEDVTPEALTPLAAGRLTRARVIPRMQIAENTKVNASAMNAPAGPTAATRSPPMAGPASWMAKGRANWSMPLAGTSSSSGTSWGTSASKAGAENAVATPMTAADDVELPEMERAAHGRPRPTPRRPGPG